MFLRRRRTPRYAVRTVAAVTLLAVATACGSDDAEPAAADDPPATAADTSDTVAPADTDAPVDTAPPAETGAAPATDAPADTEPADDLRVVSLSPTHTEMMFAIGAGDLLVAVDGFSNYPEAALELPNDLSGFEPSVEAIAGYEPDLVLIGGDFTGLGEQLAAVGIESWDGPAAANLGDVYDQIGELGAVTGQTAEADALIAEMESDIAAIVASVEQPAESLTYYHELDPTFFSVDSSTFVGEIYSLVGLQSIADQVEGDTGGFPQLNAEFIVDQNPDLIFLADTKCCGETAESVAARPGWDAIAAVQNGAITELDDDIASRWGPRVVELLEAAAGAVEAAGSGS